MSQASDPLGNRDISEQELSAFQEHGWTWLRGLLPLEHVRIMRDRARQIVANAKSTRITGSGRLDDCWFSWDNSVFEARHMRSGPFVDLALSKQMGRLASKLISRTLQATEMVSVRSLGGNLFCKLGSGSDCGREIPFHQDAPSFRVTEPGFVTIWIALDDLTPEQGPMRFLDRSHKVGALDDHRSGFPLERHPDLLEKYELTPPLRYAAGDATAHDGFMLHGSPDNMTERSRWGYACLYVASDLEFDDSAYADRPHGFLEPHERYPIVYPPISGSSE